VRFEWDEKKKSSNFAKHGVSFEEASTVFGDFSSITIEDSRHSENRFVMIGLSVHYNLLVIVHTERTNRIRIISARFASKREVEDYEKGIYG